VFAGVGSALLERLWPRPVTFRVTRKESVSAPLPLTYLMPYLLAVLIGVAAAFVLGGSVRLTHGYVLLTLITTSMFAITSLAIAVLSHRHRNTSLRGSLPPLGLAGCAVLVTLGCCLWRLPEITAPFQSPPPLPFTAL
jgi:hypothetical protein